MRVDVWVAVSRVWVWCLCACGCGCGCGVGVEWVWGGCGCGCGCVGDSSPYPKPNTHTHQQLQNSSQQNSEFWTLRKNSDEHYRILIIFRILVVVCGLAAHINNKIIKGVVREKEQAKREYREAIEKRHGAYLMHQEQPEVFSVSVGNLSVDCEVII